MESQPNELYKELLYTAAQVDERIAEMAADIITEYEPSNTMFVCLLNGAMPFSSKLMFALQSQAPDFHPNLQSMIVSRYGADRTAGELRLVTDIPPTQRDLTDKHVILLDDLIDEGDTLAYAKQHLIGYGALRVASVVLVKKLRDHYSDDVATYGFEAPDKWLTGMGMDDHRLGAEANRWAGWIAIAND